MKRDVDAYALNTTTEQAHARGKTCQGLNGERRCDGFQMNELEISRRLAGLLLCCAD